MKNILLTEWNWEDTKQVWQEEAREDGREEERKKLILRLLDVMPKEQVAQALKMTVDGIQKIIK